jgi:hypothetical protein
VNQLAALPGITFGALTDMTSFSDVWERLGRNAIGAVTGTDMSAFAAALGLTGEVQTVPFPLVVDR